MKPLNFDEYLYETEIGVNLFRSAYLKIITHVIHENYFFTGPPEAPTNCSVVNQTTDSLVVECLPSFDGGLKQFFGLEVTDLQSGALTANFTDALPEFQVRHQATY